MICLTIFWEDDVYVDCELGEAWCYKSMMLDSQRQLSFQLRKPFLQIEITAQIKDT